MTLNSNAIAILKSLLYYDVFKYPLKTEEIQKFSSVSSQDIWLEDLQFLCNHHIIHSDKEFYFLGEDLSIVERRKKGNALADTYLKRVHRHVKWLSWLPFISCICISGTLSKNYMNKHSDVDYFIIAHSNRVWIIRLFMSVLGKLLYLFRIEKYLCPNYVISEENLEIKDHNIFTAVEISTLLPMYNHTMYQEFLNANTWVKTFLPNTEKMFSNALESSIYPKNSQSLIRKVWDKIDLHLFYMYRLHYERKFNTFQSSERAPTDFVFEKNCFKAHSTPHRNKILDKYEENIRLFESKFDLHLISTPVFK